MNIHDMTVALCSVMSVPGHESECSEEIFKVIGESFDEHLTDNVGNHCFVRRCGKENAAKILIDTHFDEIGMCVTDVRDGGFLGITQTGGIDPAILQASEVVIYGNKTIRGVISSTPPHLKKADDGKKIEEMSALVVDTGYTKEELERIVRPGTPVGFAPEYRELCGRRIAGKSFDNKACAAAAVCALSDIEPGRLAGDVYLLFSCFEETAKTGGVAPAAFALEPDYAMVIDVNLARVPDVPEYETVKMGEGVSVSLSAITDAKLTRMTILLCENLGIKYQKIAAAASTGTNTEALNIVGRGIPVVDVGLPLKNMHTYTEIISLDDSEQLAALVGAFVCSEKIAEVFGR
ncbi:MAG: hypothetical protein ACI3XQ_10945 [Eubacteriales bacterium]